MHLTAADKRAIDARRTRHPAKFTGTILERVEELLLVSGFTRPPRILDPFAGVGGVHSLRERLDVDTFGVELEPEWARQHPRTIVGSALALPFADSTFDAIVTSPCYGNRMADHHEAKDASHRNTYRHALGRPLSDGSAGALQWGLEYQLFHIEAWAEAHRVLRSGGLAFINVGNHIRKGAEVHVAEWHLAWWLAMGCRIERVERILTPRLRVGANHHLRVDGEMLLVVRKP